MGIKQNYQEVNNPVSDVTVEQFYVSLWHLAGCPEVNVQDSLHCAKGVYISDYAKKAIVWAHSAGLLEKECYTLNMTRVLNKADLALRFMQCMDLGIVYGNSDPKLR